MPQQREGGFTIVELLIVIVVIAILATITVVAFNGIQTKAKVAAIVSEASAWDDSLKTYIGSRGALPSTSDSAKVICLSSSLPADDVFPEGSCTGDVAESSSDSSFKEALAEMMKVNSGSTLASKIETRYGRVSRSPVRGIYYEKASGRIIYALPVANASCGRGTVSDGSGLLGAYGSNESMNTDITICTITVK